jgi:hypothetical protein
MSSLSGFFHKGINRIRWISDTCLWEIYRLFRKSSVNRSAQLSLTIGVTTFLNRYDNCFRPLLKKLVFLFPECRIIIVANGSVLQEEQQDYLYNIRSFCSSYSNVELITYTDPMGLSHLWNRIMLNAENDKVMILNDDLKLKLGFRRFIEKGGITGDEIATINSSWSHFLISRNIYDRAGEFDEGLTEVGGEDDDYLARLAMMGIKPADYDTATIARRRKRGRKRQKINSYGRDMSKEKGRYSTMNLKYLKEKWEMSDEYFDGAVEIPRKKYKYWRLRKQGTA